MSARLYMIKHLLIQSDAQGSHFWISQSHKHECMRDLIEYYKEAKDANIK